MSFIHSKCPMLQRGGKPLQDTYKDSSINTISLQFKQHQICFSFWTSSRIPNVQCRGSSRRPEGSTCLTWFLHLVKKSAKPRTPLEYLLFPAWRCAHVPAQSSTPPRGYGPCLHLHDWQLFLSQDGLEQHFIKTALKFFSRLVLDKHCKQLLIRSAINNLVFWMGQRYFQQTRAVHLC